MSLPRVSIITPSYNQAQYLESTICSVLDQGYPNLEYMIIDGGSTDGSIDIIRRYEARLAWWVSEPDAGQSDAINKGLARAGGEYIAWLNSDDLHQPHTIAAMVEAFAQNPEAGLVYGDVLSIDGDGSVFNVMRYGSWDLDDLMAFSIIGQAGAFMRRSLLKQTGFLDSRFHYMLDHHLWLRFARVAQLCYIPCVVAAARYHPDAKNVAQAPEFAREAFQLLKWMEDQPDLAERMTPRVWAGAHRFYARYMLDGGRPRQALTHYWRGLMTHPPTALTEWHRMLYAALSLLGLEFLKPLYLRLRRALRRLMEPDVYDNNGPDPTGSSSADGHSVDDEGW